MAKKSIGAVLTLKDGDFRSKMRQSIYGFDKFNQYSKQASKGNANFERSVQNAGKKVSSFTKELVGGAAAMAGIGSTAGLIGRAFNEAEGLEGYRITLDTAVKDTKKAAETMRWAVQFANDTPFDTGPVVDATAKLQAYGMTAEAVLPSIGNMAAGMNKELDQAVEAVADAQTGELERLKEFGITKQMIVEQAAKIMRGNQIVNNKGQITDQKAFNKALFSLMDERFAGGMERQAKSFKGIKSTVTGTMSVAMAEIVGISSDGTVKAGSAFDLLKDKVNDVGAAMTDMQKDGTFDKWADTTSSAVQDIASAIGFTKDLIIVVSPLLVGLTAAYVTHKGVIISATIAQKASNIAAAASTGILAIQCAAIEYQTVVAGGGSKALGLIAAAQWLWNAAMAANPIGVVIVGVAALAAGIVWLTKNFNSVTAAVKRAWEWLTKWKHDKNDIDLKGGISSLNYDKPKSLPGSYIGANALGTSYWRGGLSKVGEHGEELVELPRGSKVYSNSQSQAKAKSTAPIYLEKLADTIVVREDADIKRIADALYARINLALANM